MIKYIYIYESLYDIIRDQCQIDFWKKKKDSLTMSFSQCRSMFATISLLVLNVLFYPLSCVAQGASCNIYNTSNTECSPKPWQLDFTCQANAQVGSCTDCFDCSKAHDYNYNCTACTDNGYIWCPGDAFCSDFPLQADFWNRMESVTNNNDLHPSCVTANDWTKTCQTNSSNVFTDPLYDAMAWIYNMIHVTSVWEQGVRGQGVRVRVNDVGGVDATHPEFASHFDQQNSCKDYLPTDSNQLIANHGTGVASIALAEANNGVCSAGIAPEATLQACILPAVANPLNYADILVKNLKYMDVSVNSWTLNACVAKAMQGQRKLQSCPFSMGSPNSPCRDQSCDFSAGSEISQLSSNCQKVIANYCLTRFELDAEACSRYLQLYAECNYDTYLSKAESNALEIGTRQGRNGKGVVYVMSAGNNFVWGGSTNDMKFLVARQTISVGAVGKDATHASYSNTGSALFICAPGGELGTLSNNIVAKSGGGCHDVSAGTSFACPVVAGVVALMLQVNPDLTWRDVQGILAVTSQQVDAGDESWVVNNASIKHSYKYGFGVVDAESSVATAKTWTLWTPEQHAERESGRIDLVIPGNATTVSSSLTVQTSLEDFKVESVVVLLDVESPSRGDLAISLTSPQGTESVLNVAPRPENTQLPDSIPWELMTVRSWGESVNGDWTLSIRDESPGSFGNGCVDKYYEYVVPASKETPTGARVTCQSIVRTESCNSGHVVNQNISVLVDPRTGLDPTASCCACGGGAAPPDKQLLKAWKIIVFGRSKTPPTPAPTNASSNGGGYLSTSGYGIENRFGLHGNHVVFCISIGVLIRRLSSALF